MGPIGLLAPRFCRRSKQENSWEASAVTGDGSIIGGRAKHVSQPLVPVRWVVINGQRQIQQIDARPGTVRGANESGDLARTVEIACSAVDGCQRAVISSASGAVTQLETLGGELQLRK